MVGRRTIGRREVEDLRGRVPCSAVLSDAGFSVDLRESSRKAVKYRRGAEIIIVIHGGTGWFDPLSDAKGDVFSLVAYLDDTPFVEALGRVARLVGLADPEPEWTHSSSPSVGNPSIFERWSSRRRPWRGSTTWTYLRARRHLPETILRMAIRNDLLREGPSGSMWAAHTDAKGAVIGWEERGPAWRGFSTGGSKILFRLGSADALRLCVTEAAIDAMSLCALEGMREGSLYLSTGGGWSPRTEAAIRRLASRPAAHLVAATDGNSQGEAFADRLRAIADDVGCDWLRLKPPSEDWNDTLRERKEGRKGREGKRILDEMCRMPAGRVKGEAAPGFACP